MMTEINTPENTARTNTLAHLSGCPADRIDYTLHEAEGIQTYHCLDCGAHEAQNLDGTVRPKPTATGPFSGPGQDWADGVTMERAI